MGRPTTEAATYKGLMIRLPDTMLQACKHAAAKERRSLNAQILWVLDEWLHETEAAKEREYRQAAHD